ncbi:hypothetical protein CANINC_000398 [Pichia inconspicua]|uniref:DUF202 domain-containing protein n=1 Tax=Pichia inconspicua TaxID=52247 RepID=A0A4T0X7H2_9ASCO|nr:hypothetical protein CANINC_000398 [[Candida] inconspicua]
MIFFNRKSRQRKDEETLKQLKPLDYTIVDIDDTSYKNHWIFRMVLLGSKKAPGGNPARDHLSNERTALAYIRTCLNLVMYGLIFLQLSKYINATVDIEELMNQNTPPLGIVIQLKSMIHTLDRFAHPLAALVFSLSFVTLIIGAYRYTRMQTLLLSPNDEFESATFLCCVIGAGFLAVSITSVVFTSVL